MRVMVCMVKAAKEKVGKHYFQPQVKTKSYAALFLGHKPEENGGRETHNLTMMLAFSSM